MERRPVNLAGTIWELQLTSKRTVIVLALGEVERQTATRFGANFHGPMCLILDGQWGGCNPGDVTAFNERWFSYKNRHSARLA